MWKLIEIVSLNNASIAMNISKGYKTRAPYWNVQHKGTDTECERGL
jgi:hypothetical protein